MAKAAKKVKRKSLPKSGARNDADLIQKCVMYAQCLSCIDATFAADPDPGNEISNNTCDTMTNQARQVLAEIAETPATTRQGLQAKARIAAMAAKDHIQAYDDELLRFFTSFANEVKDQLQPLIDDDWKSSKSEKAAA